jgi:hypothetical protein
MLANCGTDEKLTVCSAKAVGTDVAVSPYQVEPSADPSTVFVEKPEADRVAAHVATRFEYVLVLELTWKIKVLPLGAEVPFE